MKISKKSIDKTYFSYEIVQKLMNSAKSKYKVLMAVQFDSGARISELKNIKIKDIEEVPNSDELFLTLKSRKTSERKIKLMLSQNLVKQWIKEQRLKPDDYLFKLCPKSTNLYYKKLGQKIVGKPFSMNDLRYDSFCYWNTKIKENELMHRFGYELRGGINEI